MAASTLEQFMCRELHTDAIQNAQAQHEEDPCEERAAYFRFLRNRQEECSHQSAHQSIYCKSVLSKSAQYLGQVYDRVIRLKRAPADKLQQFLELVEATDADGDSQLNLLLWEAPKYKAEILGQLAGYVFKEGFTEKLLNRTNKYGQSCLIVAILAGVDVSLIRALVILGADYSNASMLVANRKDLEGVFEAPLSHDEKTQLSLIAQLKESLS